MGTIITLLTDFGHSDGYVAAMKGVILSLAPGVTLVDISHDVPAQDVAAGAPAAHLRGAGQRPAHTGLAPVRGLVGRGAHRAVLLDAPSATFHGRDILAPVAAHLARGV
ncbi:MAG: SAM-dependent chlorinase/fluorinase, partial [Chloroflexota bacterium]